MYVFGLLCTLLIATVHGKDKEGYCYPDLDIPCSQKPANVGGDEILLPNCHSEYGKFKELTPTIQSYVNAQIEKSFQFLLMSTHFGNYESNRDGFKSLYRKMSDTAWSDGIDLIKYIATRGGKMNFNQRSHLKNIDQGWTVESSELHTLARALDTQKQLAEAAIEIHQEATNGIHKDPPTAHYIEEKFFKPQSEIIRTLAGYTNDLRKLVSYKPVSAVAVFMFDEYLQKMV